MFVKNEQFSIMKYKLGVIWIFGFISLTASTTDIQRLIKIRRDWGNPSSLNSWDYTTATPISYCDWTGVACNSNGRVTQLSLPHLNLQNPVPQSLCELDIEELDLSFNGIQGTFPTALFQCRNLISLNLSSNGMEGSIPEEIRNLSKLKYLKLANNYFSGPLPATIGDLTALEMLSIEQNRLTGRIPGEALGLLSHLSVLSLSDNSFEPGPLPQQLSKLRKLTSLFAKNSPLTGTVDDQLFGLKELQQLDLSYNHLYGELPNWIWLNQNLEILSLSSNQFHGYIGPEIRCERIGQLQLSSNNFSGLIPEMGNLKYLVSIALDSNRFHGNIPASLGIMHNLMFINLSRNYLSGQIPKTMGKDSGLLKLDLSMNSLSGDLPDTLCSQNTLETLIVSHNHLTGTFPMSIAKCNTIETIIASNNAFTGNLPELIWTSCPSLKTVSFENNNLTGKLPLGLSENIREINIANNQFSGTIPIIAVGLKKFIAADNFFSHALPAEMSNLANLTHLEVQGNGIIGSIPQAIVSLQQLIVLNLSKNNLTGELNSAIGFLPALKKLDLSFNMFTGVVPASLVRWDFEDSFNGTFLCSTNSLLHLPRCPKNRGGNTRNIIIGVFSVVLFIVLIAGSIIAWKIYKRKQMPTDTNWNFVAFGPLNFNISDILNNLPKGQIIGRGASANVYRVEAKPGNTVAVKVLENVSHRQDEEDRQFEAEITALGNISHRNIIRLLCYIYNGQRDRKMLVYEFMENGTLAQWLHGSNHTGIQGEGGLQAWTTRFSIALDIAKALNYIHAELAKPVVNCDIKSSNVLLNSSFVAKLGDFGLARELGSGQFDIMSKVRGTFGYMAPEYGMNAEVSVMQDIYSFGVVLLELVTGQKAVENGQGLAEWARQRHHHGTPPNDIFYRAMDPSGHDTFAKLFEVAVDCVNYNPRSRPRMDAVFHRLKHIWDESGGHGDSSLFSIPLSWESGGHGNSSLFGILRD